MSRKIERYEDMSPKGKLMLIEQPDGDVIIGISPDPDAQDFFIRSVEFCTPIAGGGQSPRTLRALKELMVAVELDNRLEPQNRD